MGSPGDIQAIEASEALGDKNKRNAPQPPAKELIEMYEPKFYKQDQYSEFIGIAHIFSDIIEAAIRTLLEERHLYQNLSFNWPSVEDLRAALPPHPVGTPTITPRPASLDAQESTRLQRIRVITIGSRWLIRSRPYRNYEEMKRDRVPAHIQIVPPTVRAYCRTCKEIYPYNYIESADIFTNPNTRTPDAPTEYPPDQQVFILSYQCQGCKSRPELFMIERSGSKLQLVGRSPMEKVLVPKAIPESIASYYSDAVIAFNSGQVLAGKFLMRTMLEQFARSKAPDEMRQTDNIEDLFSSYADGLPLHFKDAYPSLYAVYGRLSDDLHSADATADGFLDCREDIEGHFEAWDVYVRRSVRPDRS